MKKEDLKPMMDRICRAHKLHGNDPQFQPDPASVELVKELVDENMDLARKLKGAERYSLFVTILCGILLGAVILLVAS